MSNAQLEVNGTIGLSGRRLDDKRQRRRGFATEMHLSPFEARGPEDSMTGLGASVFCRQAERSEVCGEPGPSQFSFGGLGRILRNQSGLVLVWPSWLPIQALAFRDLKIARQSFAKSESHSRKECILRISIEPVRGSLQSFRRSGLPGGSPNNSRL